MSDHEAATSYDSITSYAILEVTQVLINTDCILCAGSVGGQA